MPTPEKTSFQPDDDTLIRQVAEECPAALACETDFVDYMVVLYRKFQKDEKSVRHDESDVNNNANNKCNHNKNFEKNEKNENKLDFNAERLNALMPTAAQPIVDPGGRC